MPSIFAAIVIVLILVILVSLIVWARPAIGKLSKDMTGDRRYYADKRKKLNERIDELSECVAKHMSAENNPHPPYPPDPDEIMIKQVGGLTTQVEELQGHLARLESELAEIAVSEMRNVALDSREQERDDKEDIRLETALDIMEAKKQKERDRKNEQARKESEAILSLHSIPNKTWNLEAPKETTETKFGDGSKSLSQETAQEQIDRIASISELYRTAAVAGKIPELNDLVHELDKTDKCKCLTTENKEGHGAWGWISGRLFNLDTIINIRYYCLDKAGRGIKFKLEPIIEIDTAGKSWKISGFKECRQAAEQIETLCKRLNIIDTPPYQPPLSAVAANWPESYEGQKAPNNA